MTSTPYNVLVVDDDPDLRDALCTAFHGAGFKVTGADNGLIGLAELMAMPPPTRCVVVLDLTMPIMDGWEFLDRLRALPQCTRFPVIVFSATSRTAELERMPCVAAFLQKPAVFASVIELVREHASPIVAAVG